MPWSDADFARISTEPSDRSANIAPFAPAKTVQTPDSHSPATDYVADEPLFFDEEPASQAAGRRWTALLPQARLGGTVRPILALVVLVIAAVGIVATSWGAAPAKEPSQHRTPLLQERFAAPADAGPKVSPATH